MKKQIKYKQKSKQPRRKKQGFVKGFSSGSRSEFTSGKWGNPHDRRAVQGKTSGGFTSVAGEIHTSWDTDEKPTQARTSLQVKSALSMESDKKKIVPVAPHGSGLEGIFEAYGIELTFPTAVLQEVESLPENPTPASIRSQIRHGRRDLRSLLTFTIDGVDAKDLDDALSIISLPTGGWKLYVHIADVSHYVPANCALDKEALHRGTSIYPVDRVIPMLPPELSNGLCSLHPDVDRLTLTVELEYDVAADLLSGEIYESVISSDVRADYDTVQQYFATGKLPSDYAKIHQALDDLRELCAKLMQKRRRNGALQLEIPERKVCLDAEGKVVDIRQISGNEAHEVIEACMISANIFVAQQFDALNYPFMYRVHEKPDMEKLLRVVRYAQMYGLTVSDRRKWQAKDVSVLLNQLESPAEKQVLTQLLLRSLAKAKYSHRCLGHDGLGLRHYSHFTSPIRRYPDLFNHRIIKSYLHGKKPLQKWSKLLPEWSEHCSVRERTAMVVERETVDYKMAEYMSSHLGEVFVAQVCGLLNSGLFVSVENGAAEGFLPFSNLPDHLIFDEDDMVVRGRRSGLTISLGDMLVVRLAAVQVEQRKIDFILEDSEAYPLAKQLCELRQKERSLRDRFSYRRFLPGSEPPVAYKESQEKPLSFRQGKKQVLKDKHRQKKKARKAARTAARTVARNTGLKTPQQKGFGNEKAGQDLVSAALQQKNHDRIDQLLSRVHQELQSHS